jgi:myo-inositol-hexaphosphate 3-phosphohydrolase
VRGRRPGSPRAPYDLAGNLLQNLPVSGKPGNIDIRYDVPVGAGTADVVVLTIARPPACRRSP